MNICLSCGIPLDAGIFDSSTILNIRTAGEAQELRIDPVSLSPGESVELARFELQPEFCGVLLAFSQFTNQYAKESKMSTPGYQWSLLADGRPLCPWLKFDRIINPWGLSGFPLAVRLEQGTVLSLVVENINVEDGDKEHWLTQIGGRIVGRYWLNDEYVGQRHLQTYEPWK